VGAGNTALLRRRLLELYDENPEIVVAIESSIKGTNRKEFQLLSRSDGSLFEPNIKAYYNLRELNLPNVRPTVIAGFGISESFLLTRGKNPKSLMTILSDEQTPAFHPSLWSEQFEQLYSDFTNDYEEFDSMFSLMPMYGINDQFSYPWVGRSIKLGKSIYKDRWYDSKYVAHREAAIEEKFNDILAKFFLVDNQTYYSTLIKH